MARTFFRRQRAPAPSTASPTSSPGPRPRRCRSHDPEPASRDSSTAPCAARSTSTTSPSPPGDLRPRPSLRPTATPPPRHTRRSIRPSATGHARVRTPPSRPSNHPAEPLIQAEYCVDGVAAVRPAPALEVATPHLEDSERRHELTPGRPAIFLESTARTDADRRPLFSADSIRRATASSREIGYTRTQTSPSFRSSPSMAKIHRLAARIARSRAHPGQSKQSLGAIRSADIGGTSPRSFFRGIADIISPPVAAPGRALTAGRPWTPASRLSPCIPRPRRRRGRPRRRGSGSRKQ